jgi:RNA polymerase sigma-70 factor, ECF subfamily
MDDHDVTPDALERAKHGDIDGLEALYRAFGDRVYRLCRSVLGDDHAAEDATQEVFLRIFSKIASFDGRSKLSTWIYRLSLNHCLNLRRRFLRWPAALVERTVNGAVDRARDGQRMMERIEAKDEVDRLLRDLPRDQRAVLALRELLELEYKEIAAVLEVPEGTVMSRLSRARTALAAAVSRREQPFDHSNVEMDRAVPRRVVP